VSIAESHLLYQRPSVANPMSDLYLIVTSGNISNNHVFLVYWFTTMRYPRQPDTCIT